MSTRSHQELVQYLVRSMEQQGLDIDAATSPGYRKPAPIKGGLMRSKLRPDVVARDGRRTVFGIAMTTGAASTESTRNLLEVLASKCRVVVICVAEDSADQVVGHLLRDAAKPHWRKMRLLRHPQTAWQEMPRRRPTRASFNPVVTVRA